MSETKNNSEKMVKIRLPLTRTENSDLFVGYNGTPYLIKRGVDVEVPKAVADIIAESERQDAITVMNEIKMSEESKF